MNAIDIGERIATLRKGKGLSQSELARALDIKPQAVQKWESGGSGPKVSRLKEIAETLRVGLPELVRGTVYEYIAPSSDTEPDVIFQEPNGTVVLAQAKTHKRTTNSQASWGKVPLITWELAGMWANIMNSYSENDVLEWIEVPNARDGVFCLKVEDESAVGPAGQKSYLPGEVIAVDPDKVPKNRSTVVIVLKPGTKPVLRQLLLDGASMYLRTINPSWPNGMTEMPDESYIVGTVTGKWVPEE